MMIVLVVVFLIFNINHTQPNALDGMKEPDVDHLHARDFRFRQYLNELYAKKSDDAFVDDNRMNNINLMYLELITNDKND
jgi:hypothetical protein